MGTCGLVGTIGVFTGWNQEILAGTRSVITGTDWAALIMVSIVMPVLLTVILGPTLRKIGWIKPGDLKLE